MATRGDCTPKIPPERERLGLYTASEVEALYGMARSTLSLLAARGVLHRVTPRTLTRPAYYRRDELEAAITGAGR